MTKTMKIIEKLGTACDELNALLDDCQTVIQSKFTGVEAMVPLDNMGELWFKKYHGDWLLAVERGDYESSLLKASRADRIQSAIMLEQLEDALFNELNTLNINMGISVRAARAFVYRKKEGGR